jgi:hypothetical protein
MYSHEIQHDVIYEPRRDSIGNLERDLGKVKAGRAVQPRGAFAKHEGALLRERGEEGEEDGKDGVYGDLTVSMIICGRRIGCTYEEKDTDRREHIGLSVL